MEVFEIWRLAWSIIRFVTVIVLLVFVRLLNKDPFRYEGKFVKTAIVYVALTVVEIINTLIWDCMFV